MNAPSSTIDAPLTEDPVETIRRENPEALHRLQETAMVALVRIAADQLEHEEREAA